MKQKLKFGIKIPAMKGWFSLVQEAETQGFDTVWLQSDMAYNDSYSAFGYAASQTASITFAPYANSVFLRHPVLIASGLANLNEIASGRIKGVFASAGYETSVRLHIPDEDSVQAVREAIEITRQLWTGNVVNYSGTHWQLSDVHLPYVESTDIPLYIATRGTKFVLAGEVADGIVTHGKAQGYLERVSKDLAIGSKKTSQNADQIERAIVLPILLCDKTKVEETRESVKPMLADFVGGEFALDWLNSFNISLEEVEPLRKHIRAGKTRDTIGELVSTDLRDRLIEGYAIVGTPEEAIEDIYRMEKYGATEIIPMIIPDWYPTLVDMKKYIQAFNEKIVSAFPSE